MKNLWVLAVIVCVGVCLPGCKKKQGDQFAGIDGDFVSGTPLSDRMDGANFFGGNVQRGQFSPVYFGYDSFDVSGEEQGKIQQVATALRSSKDTVIIAGFTDERGTEEYNRGLGEKRALAVREALIAAGVPASRIQTVSFGEEMPADPGSGDSAWAMNRRAEFGVVQ
jgi:peptidoglycan-associated lipoprotein